MGAVYIAILLFASPAPGVVSPDAIQQAEQDLFAARYDRAAELYYGAVRALIGAYRGHEACSGDLTRAEACFRKALNINTKYAAALSGWALLYSSTSKFKTAQALTIAAYQASSGDPRLIAAWANALRGEEHIAALQRALAIYDPDSREARGLRAYVARDKAVGKRTLRRLTTPYQSYQMKLVPISAGGGQPYGVGVRAQLNKGHTVLLILDTGASGISISPKAAEKAGLEVLSDESTEAHGIGSQKPPEAFGYLAGEVTIGDLQFADFPVATFRGAKTSGYDGIIGADVFQRFLGTSRLFLIDSGAYGNLIDADVAKASTKGRGDYQTELRGIQGRADKVFRASQVSLVFAGFRQDNSDLLATSLEALGDESGVGNGGILGMPVLRQVKMTIDYRNGAVRFEPKK
jgi:hypothetical protein